MRIIIAGGGNAVESRPLDETFAEWIGRNGRLLYLPVAMDGISNAYHESMAWLESVFMPHGVINITMCAELEPCLKRELNFYNAIYMGGGNTYRLLYLLRTSGFDRALVHFARTGGAVYGGSAGAIVLGKEISTSAHLDANEVGINDLSGLDLLGGYSVWCHYHSDDDERIRAYTHGMGYPVIALSESAGVCLMGGRLRACGYEAVRVFNDGANQFVRPGEEVPAAR
jgi:dipeptidase E